MSKKGGQINNLMGGCAYESQRSQPWGRRVGVKAAASGVIVGDLGWGASLWDQRWGVTKASKNQNLMARQMMFPRVKS